MMNFFLFMQSAHVSSERAVYRIFPATHKKNAKRWKSAKKNVLLLLCGLFSHFCRIYNFFCEIYTMNISPFTSFIPRFFCRFFFIMEKCEIHVFGWCENKIKFDQKTADEKWTERKKKFCEMKKIHTKKIRYNNTYASNWPPSCTYTHPPKNWEFPFFYVWSYVHHALFLLINV
jgi:hypothetical protein